MTTRLHTYDGTDATVTWDQARCLHVAACVHGLPDVFDPERKPWIEPDEAGPEALADVVMRCPTGALHLRLADGTDPEPTPSENTVTLAADGPLYVRGDVRVRTAAGEELLRDTRVALCRCGLSSNKPLCDNSHVDRFEDSGALADPAGPMEIEGLAGQPLVVTVRPNGSLLLEGPFTVTGADGASTTKPKAGLCRCGHSHTKPFCDGSHRAAGFVAD